MIDPFWTTFQDWHVRTDHEWDYALHREAMVGYIREDLQSIAERAFHDMFVGPPEGQAFTGLRAILDGTKPS